MSLSQSVRSAQRGPSSRSFSIIPVRLRVNSPSVTKYVIIAFVSPSCSLPLRPSVNTLGHSQAIRRSGVAHYYVYLGPRYNTCTLTVEIDRVHPLTFLPSFKRGSAQAGAAAEVTMLAGPPLQKRVVSIPGLGKCAVLYNNKNLEMIEKTGNRLYLDKDNPSSYTYTWRIPLIHVSLLARVTVSPSTFIKRVKHVHLYSFISRTSDVTLLTWRFPADRWRVKFAGTHKNHA